MRFSQGVHEYHGKNGSSRGARLLSKLGRSVPLGRLDDLLAAGTGAAAERRDLVKRLEQLIKTTNARRLR